MPKLKRTLAPRFLRNALGRTPGRSGARWPLAALALASVLASPDIAGACTTVLVGKALTADGSVLHAHNEDMGNEAAGRLWYEPGAEHQAGERFRVPYVELEHSGERRRPLQAPFAILPIRLCLFQSSVVSP